MSEQTNRQFNSSKQSQANQILFHKSFNMNTQQAFISRNDEMMEDDPSTYEVSCRNSQLKKKSHLGFKNKMLRAMHEANRKKQEMSVTFRNFRMKDEFMDSLLMNADIAPQIDQKSKDQSEKTTLQNNSVCDASTGLSPVVPNVMIKSSRQPSTEIGFQPVGLKPIGFDFSKLATDRKDVIKSSHAKVRHDGFNSNKFKPPQV